MTQRFYFPADFNDDWIFSAFADMEKLWSTANIKFPLSNVLIEKESGTMIIELALAGYKPEDVNLTVEDNCIILDSVAQKKDDKYDIVYQDIRRSAFKQKIPVSSKFDLTKIEATFENGILIIKVPVAEERKPKKIQIK